MTKVAQNSRDRQYWLLKSEPDSFSFDDLWNLPGRTTGWDGVRNYQARNYMRDEMKKGDLAFFYHSGAEPGIVGVVEIVREGYPDQTAVDPKDPFPRYHGQGSRLKRPGDSMPRVAPVTKLAITK